MKWSISVFVALVLATTGGAAVQAADREGMWETSVGIVFQNSTEADFKGGSQAEFDSDTSFKLGFDYHYTSRPRPGVQTTDRKFFTALVVTLK